MISKFIIIKKLLCEFKLGNLFFPAIVERMHCPVYLVYHSGEHSHLVGGDLLGHAHLFERRHPPTGQCQVGCPPSWRGWLSSKVCCYQMIAKILYSKGNWHLSTVSCFEEKNIYFNINFLLKNRLVMQHTHFDFW